MSLLEKGSVYEQPSVYNQGGDGSFDVEPAPGVTEKLNFPQYLVPVEYINLENFSGKLSILGSKQFYCKNTYSVKVVFSLKTANMQSTSTILDIEPPLGYNGTASFILYVEKSTSHITIRFSYSGILHVFNADNINWNTDNITLTYSASTKIVLIKDEHGQTASSTGSAPSSNPMGSWTLMGANQLANVRTLHGKFFYMWLRDDSDNSIVGLWIPARNKDGRDNPYIAECVSCGVGLNYSETFSTTGVEFGNDIDLSNISSYFV